LSGVTRMCATYSLCETDDLSPTVDRFTTVLDTNVSTS
jgi:hypothetical protein